MDIKQIEEGLPAAEKGLLAMYDQEVDRNVFSFSTQCLNVQTAKAITGDWPLRSKNDIVSGASGVDLDKVRRITNAFVATPYDRDSDYDYCRGIAVRILAGEDLSSISHSERGKPIDRQWEGLDV